MGIEGRVALITGASSGIGEATAFLLAKEGCDLAIGARRVERIESLAERIRTEFGRRVFASALDVRSSESVERFIASAVSELGNLHIVVSNAGVALGMSHLSHVSDDESREMISTNVEGTIRVIRTCIPHIRSSGFGHIVIIASIAGLCVYEGGGVYCASKHAVRAIAATLRLELCGEPIRVTTISPGMVETEFSLVRLGDMEKAREVYKGMTPLTAHDIAECIRWAVSLPAHVNIDEIVIKPLDQAAPHKVHRVIKNL